MMRKKLIAQLREIDVIHREPVRLRSGKVAAFYCDIKKAYGYPDILDALAAGTGKLIPKGTTCVAASGYGGLPLAAAVSLKLGLNFTAVRDRVKNHGKGGYIDGYVPLKKDRVVIVDDVLTTGSSIKTTYSVLKKSPARVVGAVVVVKRGEGRLPIPCRYLFLIGDLIK